MIYALAATIAACGILAAGILGVDGLATTSSVGLPWSVPAAGAVGLLIVAEMYHRRSDSGLARRDLGSYVEGFGLESARKPGQAHISRKGGPNGRRAVLNLYRQLATAYVLGAACAALVPIRGVVGVEVVVLELVHHAARLALAFFAGRALWINLRLALRFRRRESTAAATASALAIGGAFVAALFGPPPVEMVMTNATLVYGLNVAAPAAQLAVMPRAV